MSEPKPLLPESALAPKAPLPIPSEAEGPASSLNGTYAGLPLEPMADAWGAAAARLGALAPAPPAAATAIVRASACQSKVEGSPCKPCKAPCACAAARRRKAASKPAMASGLALKPAPAPVAAAAKAEAPAKPSHPAKPGVTEAALPEGTSAELRPLPLPPPPRCCRNAPLRIIAWALSWELRSSSLLWAYEQALSVHLPN
mmetsp:Transcript_44359/g.127034  ORF Transcript_44359/g.127034 Transcript_44359/m.127034 type:complete len:201 (+) Transcript_44359:647-1249(+)